MAKSDKDPDKHSLFTSAKPSGTSDLASRIARARKGREDGTAPSQGQQSMSTLAMGLRLGTEFAAAILVGTGIGYVIDQVAGTRPWAMLIMFMLGFAAGILNVTRVVAEMGKRSSGSDEGTGRR